MRENKQAYLHDPSNGIYGDCFRTAISCVLEIDRDQVPHVFHDGCDGFEADRRMNAWLAERGLTQFVLAFEGNDLTLEQLLSPVNAACRDALPEFLLYGRSKNGTDHVVICRGNEIVWDPSQDDSGIVGPCKDGNWWIVVLAATRPRRKSESRLSDESPRSMIERLAQVAEAVAFHAGVGGCEIAGAIVSYLAAHPESVDAFLEQGIMALPAELWANGRLTFHRQSDGAVTTPQELRIAKTVRAIVREAGNLPPSSDVGGA
jgi:hypothetical protein